MATHRKEILGPASLPDSSGGVFFEPFSVKATNDLFNKLVCIFNDTATDIKLGFSFRVPKQYVSAPKIVGVFASTATTGNYVWRVEYRAVATAEAGDPTTVQETVTSAGITVPGTALFDQEQSLSLTAGNLAVDDRVSGHIVRVGTSGSDTLAAALILHPEMLAFEFADA